MKRRPKGFPRWQQLGWNGLNFGWFHLSRSQRKAFMRYDQTARMTIVVAKAGWAWRQQRSDW